MTPTTSLARAIACATFLTSTLAHAAESRLGTLNKLSCTVNRTREQASTLSEVFVAHAYVLDYETLPTLAAALASSEREYLASPALGRLTDADVTQAFDNWRALFQGPKQIPTSPFALHIFRASLMAFAPCLVTRDQEGLPSVYLSPIEAIYLFDFLLSHGAVPAVDPHIPETDVTPYTTALSFYVQDTTKSKRRTDLEQIVFTTLLK